MKINFGRSKGTPRVSARSAQSVHPSPHGDGSEILKQDSVDLHLTPTLGGVGDETPELLVAQSEMKGALSGSAQLSEGQAIGKDSFGVRRILAIGDRLAAQEETSHGERRVPLARTQAGTNERVGKAGTRGKNALARANRIEQKYLPVAEAKRTVAEEKLERAKDYLKSIPLPLRLAYATAIAAAVVGLFAAIMDVPVIYLALQRELKGTWLTLAVVGAVTAVIAINWAVGAGLGWVLRQFSAEVRRNAMLGVIVAGALALLAFLITVGIFRAQAASHFNDALRDISQGNISKLSLHVPMYWMIPLQAAGSIAAILAAALHTLGGEGREARADVASAAMALADTDEEVKVLELKVERYLDVADDASLEAFELRATSDEAGAELTELKPIFAARVRSARALADSAAQTYQFMYRYVHRIHMNGKVARMQLPSIIRGRRATEFPPQTADFDEQPDPLGNWTPQTDDTKESA